VFSKKDLVDTLGAARSLESEGPLTVAKSAEGVPLPWVPVIVKPGTYCLLKSQPEFGRINTDFDSKISLIPAKGIGHEKIWPKEQKLISISEFLDEESEKYTLFLPSSPTQSTLHVLLQDDMSTTEQVAWLAEHDCNDQAVQLLAAAPASSQ